MAFEDSHRTGRSTVVPSPSQGVLVVAPALGLAVGESCAGVPAPSAPASHLLQGPVPLMLDGDGPQAVDRGAVTELPEEFGPAGLPLARAGARKYPRR